MSLAELEATVAWLERNRLLEHVDVLGDDASYDWAARRRKAGRARTRAGAGSPTPPA